MQKDIQCIESVQLRAARFIHKDYSSHSSVTSMLQSLGWTDLKAYANGRNIVGQQHTTQGHSQDFPLGGGGGGKVIFMEKCSHLVEMFTSNTSVVLRWNRKGGPRPPAPPPPPLWLHPCNIVGPNVLQPFARNHNNVGTCCI